MDEVENVLDGGGEEEVEEVVDEVVVEEGRGVASPFSPAEAEEVGVG